MTELYQHVHHHASIDEFIDNLTARAEQEGKPRLVLLLSILCQERSQ